MSNEEHTSDRTSLGYVLQYLVEDGLNLHGIKFESNCDYYKSFIKPDVLIPGNPPKYSVHVTATGADNSFQMKKWRYVDEVLQMRSVWEDDFLSINVLFGPTNGYRDGDITLLKSLFDREVVVEKLNDGIVIFEMAIEALSGNDSGKKSREIADDLMTKAVVRTVVGEIGKAIKKIVSSGATTDAPKDSCARLSGFLHEREKYIKKAPPIIAGKAFWKRTLLRFLAVTPDYWPQLFKLATGEVNLTKLDARLVREASRAKLTTIREGATGIKFVALSAEASITIKAGLSLDLVESVGKSVYADPRRRFELLDLWDDGVRAKQAIEEVAEAHFQGAADLTKLLDRSIHGGGSELVPHHRAHVIDVILAAIDFSQNQLQARYSGPEVGVKNPIPNMVPRTDIATQAIATGKIDTKIVAQSIVESVETEINAVDWTATQDLVRRYLALRVYNLTKGSSIDPLEEYVAAILQQADWTISKPKIVTKHPMVGKLTTVFSVVAVKGNHRLILKCLFGDTGADHKAEEMEARMRMVRVEPTADFSNTHTVFVADGKWSSNNITSLVLGGWDHVVSVADFRPLLATL
jgi:hypothetical protein